MNRQRAINGLPRWLSGKESVCQCRRHKIGWFYPWIRRSPGGGHGNPLQYSCLESPWTEAPGGIQSIGSQRVRHNWNDLACIAIKGIELVTQKPFHKETRPRGFYQQSMTDNSNLIQSLDSHQVGLNLIIKARQEQLKK